MARKRSERKATPPESSDTGTTSIPVDGSESSSIGHEDLSEVPWQDGWPENIEIRDLDRVFYTRAQAAAERGEAKEAAVYTMLGHACSLYLLLDSPEQPFRPKLRMGDFRSASIDELNEESVKAFAKAVPSVRHPEVRARFGDLAWVRVRDHAAAGLAIDAYLEAAASYGPEHWHEMVRYLERALQVALWLGRRSEQPGRVFDRIQSLLFDRDLPEEGFRPIKLMRLLVKYEGGNLAALASLANSLGERAFATDSWDRARDYFDLAATFARRASDAEGARSALLRVADSFVRQAEGTLKQKGVGHLLASRFMMRAIETLRRLGGMRERIAELHVRLVDIQAGAPGELARISHPVDLTELAAAAEQAVTGLPLPNALIALAALPVLASKERLHKSAESQAKEFILSSLFPKLAIDIDGKVLGYQKSTNSNDPQEREAAIRVEMITQAAMHYSISAFGTIKPARDALVREHPLRVDDVREIVSFHPLITEGRELLVAEGLHAGFFGDMTRAIHLLVPQLEQLIRDILERSGVTVSALDKYGVQEERNLNKLLYEPKLRELIGDDTVFSLQALLVEKFGPDLRNRMAHGLLDYHSFFTGEALAVWWLSLRLVMIPLMKAVAQRAEEKTEPISPT